MRYSMKKWRSNDLSNSVKTRLDYKISGYIYSLIDGLSKIMQKARYKQAKLDKSDKVDTDKNTLA